MLQLVHPELHGYVGAELDEKGEPIKINCDVLEVLAYYIDSQTAPDASLVVTYARVDPRNNFKKGGPYTQHVIIGLELIAVLEEPGGITIKAIEDSTLRTGIPMAHIRAEDLKPYEPGPAWNERIIDLVKRQMEAQRTAQGLPMTPPMMTSIPGAPA